MNAQHTHEDAAGGARLYALALRAPHFPIVNFTAPVDGDFSWINQGGASVDTTTITNAIYLAAPAGAGTNLRVRTKAAPATPWTLTTYISPRLQAANFNLAGVGFRDNTLGYFNGIEVLIDTISGNIAPFLRDVNYTSPTTFSGANLTVSLPMHGLSATGFYIQLADDGTNRHTRVSNDGINFNNIRTVARLTDLTPSHICFWAASTNASFAGGVWLLSWLQA